MRKTTLPIAVLLLLGSPAILAQGAPETPQSAIAAIPQAIGTITAADLEKHLRVIASDAFEGRLTATEGQVKTALYIADHFKELGLKPLGDEVEGKGRDWFHAWPVHVARVLKESGLSAGEPLHQHGAWLLPRRRGDVEVKGQARFLGRIGRGAKIDGDLASLIPIVTIEADASKDDEATIMSAMMRGMMNELGLVRQAAKQLADAGAKAGVVLAPEWNLALITACNQLAAYPGKPIVSQREGGSGAFPIPGPRIPMLVLAGDDARRVLESIGLSAQDAFAEGAVESVSEKSLKLLLKLEEEETKAVNVVGLLEGSDPKLKSEALVYSAHMDHVGMGPDGHAFNGADDDGSGTVALLEIAEAFAKLAPAERPKRSIIFLSVSGEELGLWGSEAYSDNPTWPMEKIAANINIDMIGRSTEKVTKDEVSVTPTYRHRAYSTLVREAAFLGQAYDLSLENGDKFYERSDHYNFARKGVPVVFFCDDEHVDYHMPSDDVDKIEFAKMERIVRLAFALGYRTADRVERPERIGKRPSWTGDAVDVDSRETDGDGEEPR